MRFRKPSYLDVGVGLLFLFLFVPTTHVSAATTIGYLDAIDQNGLVSGWAFDPDNSSQSIDVHFIIDGPAGAGTLVGVIRANLSRPDVNASYGISGNHAFAASIPVQYLNNSAHTLYVYAIDTDPNATNIQINNSPKNFSVAPHNPFGALDGVNSSGVATGWAVDLDQPSSSIVVHFYIDQPAGSGPLVDYSRAGDLRPDLNSAVGLTGNHGFSYTIPEKYRDGKQHTLYAYGINIDGTPGVNVELPNSLPPTFTLAPRQLPTLGNATITGNGITIKTTARLAGAIDSLQWNGKEFVDSADHGRQIQTAWTGNNLGECFNPTEAGSGADGAGPATHSQLLSITTTNTKNSLTTNSLTTISHPAFWQAPGTFGWGCNFNPNNPNVWDGGNTVNTTLTTEAMLKKTVTIGYQDIPNAVEYVSEITLSANELARTPLRYMMMINPAIYMPTYFSRGYRFDPASNTMTELGHIVPSFASYGMTPVIAATSDGAYAMGIYTDEITPSGFPQNEQKAFTGYSFVNWNVATGIFPRIPEVPPSGSTFSAGTYSYRTFLVVGSISDVKNSIQALYKKFNPSSVPTPNVQPPPTPINPITPAPTPTPPTTPNPAPAPSNNSAIIQSLLQQIQALQYQIDSLKSKVNNNASSVSACLDISNNLAYRSRDVSMSGDVSTLQDFLRSKGYLNSESTGFFGVLTLQAVKSFQQVNGISSTGFVGPLTRAKIKSLTCGQ